MKISALMSIHQDNAYLPLVIEQIYDVVDEIILLDGPFQWLVDFFTGLPLDHGSRLHEVIFRGAPLLSHKKVRHFHRNWRNDIEKRAFGYDACMGDLVLVVDSDELFEINLPAIQAFWSSPHPVAKFEVYSLGRTYARMEFPIEDLEYAVANADQPYRYFRLFKKTMLTGEEHVPYLQVLHPIESEPIKPADLSVIQDESIGRIYHLCVMRTGFDNLIKYLFYKSYYHLSTGQRDSILVKGGWSSYGEMLQEISIEDYFSILLRGSPDSMRVPSGRAITRFDRLPQHLTKLLCFSDDVSKDLGTNLEKPLAVVKEHKMFFHLPSDCRAGARCDIYVKDIHYLKVWEYQAFYQMNNANNFTTLYQGRPQAGMVSVIIPALTEEISDNMFARMLAIYSGMPEGKNVGWIEKIEVTPFLAGSHVP